MTFPAATDLSFGILLNGALLLALAQVANLALARGRILGQTRTTGGPIPTTMDLSWRTLWPAIAAGVLVGLIGILLIRLSALLMPGVIFDTRSVLLALCGLFLGPLPTVIAMLLTAAYRLWVGGVAAPVGVLVILASGLLGLLWRWRYWAGLESLNWRPLYALGLAVHGVMMTLMLLLPWETARVVLGTAGVPVLIIHSLLTVALGLLIVDRLRRQHDQERLREQEERYRSLFDNGHTPMLIIDPDDGRIVDANETAARFYSWRRDELRTMRFARINTLPENEVRRAMQRALHGEASHFEFEHRRADGGARPVEVFVGPIRFGGHDYLYSIIHDLSARRAAEAALAKSEAARARDNARALAEQLAARRAALNLTEDAQHARREAIQALASARESEARFVATFELAAVGIAHIAPNGRWLRVNDRLCAIVGFTRDELLGLSFQDITHPDDLASDIEHVQDMLAHRIERYEMDKRYRRKDGSDVWVHLTVSLVLKDDGTPDYFISVVEDISERKRAEAALRDSEATYRSLFENMINGFAYHRMIYDNDQPVDYLYLAVNRAFAAQAGLGEVVGKRVSEVLPGLRQSDPQLFEIYGRVARGGMPEHFETFVSTMQRWFEITVYSPQPEQFRHPFRRHHRARAGRRGAADAQRRTRAFQPGDGRSRNGHDRAETGSQRPVP